MWFKQAQLFKFENRFNFNAEKLEDRLDQLRFTPCLSALPFSQGWVSPIDDTDDNAPLVYSAPGFLLFCFQTEEKLLPIAIVNQKLKEQVRKIELEQDRKVPYKEKNILKQEIYNKLLPQAFGKLTRNHAFIDIKNNRLILDTNNQKRTEKFISFFKRSLGNIKIISPATKKLSPLLTRWLINKNCPTTLSIEDACVLQDPEQPNRNVRIQHQDLSASCVQALLKDNLEISQIKMTWKDQITFVLKNDFTLQSLQYQDALTEESNRDKADIEEGIFRADFFIMSGTLTKMFKELLEIFTKTGSNQSKK